MGKNLIKKENIALVYLKDKEALTTSLKIAEAFGKQHFNVLQTIDKLKKENPDIFTDLKIQVSYYTDKSGKRNKMYLLNRDAFSFIAMGFTGRKAMEFKLQFIKAFNKMEDYIKQRLDSAREYRLMCDVLKEVRLRLGKDIEAYHYVNEAKLVNYALTGKFSKVERNKLQLEELHMLEELEKTNAVLLGLGYDYPKRKELLLEKARMLKG